MVFAGTAFFVSHATDRPRILQTEDSDTLVTDFTFTDRMAIDLGGKRVELIYAGRNHSDNNFVVLCRRTGYASP